MLTIVRFAGYFLPRFNFNFVPRLNLSSSTYFCFSTAATAGSRPSLLLKLLGYPEENPSRHGSRYAVSLQRVYGTVLVLLRTRRGPGDYKGL